MFRKRGLILITFSLLLGFGAAVLARGWVADQSDKDKTDTVTVVAAAIAIPFGSKIEERHLKIIEMPKDSAPPGSFSKGRCHCKSDYAADCKRGNPHAGEICGAR